MAERNKKVKVKSFKGMETTINRHEIGIDVANNVENAVYDIDGGIRKREGFATKDTTPLNVNGKSIEFVEYEKVIPTIINVSKDELDNSLKDTVHQIKLGDGFHLTNRYENQYELQLPFEDSGNWLNTYRFDWILSTGDFYLNGPVIPSLDFLTSIEMEYTEYVGSMSFSTATKLKRVFLPSAKQISLWAFIESEIEVLSLPVAETIGNLAFSKIKNKSTTVVTMKSKFNTDSEKDRIFGAGNWSNIKFTWI